MGNVTSRLMQLYAKNRSIEEFWEFNDSLPSTVSNRYLSSAVNAISDENFGQFLGGIFDRKGKAGYSEYNVQQLLERWGKKDPQAAIDWLDQSSYDDRYSHRVYASILQAGNLDEFPELTQRFVEDDRLSNKILQGVLQTVYSKQGVERFKKVFQSLPEGSSYGLEDIKQRVGTLYYNSPLLIPDLVSAVPNKDDQLELLESGFSKIANEHRRYQFNEADFSLLEKRLEETLLTIEEREDLMNKARKHFEKK